MHEDPTHGAAFSNPVPDSSPSSIRISSPDTLNLARAAQAGDVSARDELFSRYAPRALELARWRCGHSRSRWADHEDIAQDALMRAFTGLDGFDPDRSEGSFLSWLSRCVRTALNEQHRVEHTRKRGGGQEARMGELKSGELLSGLFAGDDATPSAEAMGAELAERLDEGLVSLPENYRNAIVDHSLCGQSYREMSEHLGLSEQNVRVMVHRALKKLKTAVPELE